MTPEEKIMEVLPVFTPHIARMQVRDQEPGWHYRWVTLNDDRIQFMKEQGYELVTDNKDTKTEAAGRRIVGRSVLMRCPQEMFERREQARRMRSRLMLAGPREKVKTTGEQLGLEVTDKTREYRAPLSQAMSEPSEKPEFGREGTITRQQVEKFNQQKE